MAQFTDTGDVTWQVAINAWDLKDVRKQFGVNLVDLSEAPTGIWAGLFGDVVKFIDVLYWLCREQCEARKVSDQQFGEGLAGDAITRARDAFLEALTDFFPSPGRRKAVYEMIQKVQEMDRALIDHSLEELQQFDPLTAVNDYFNSAGNSAASAA